MQKAHRIKAFVPAKNFVLAKQFNVQVEQNTASVLLSTAFSVVTVSALRSLLTRVCPSEAWSRAAPSGPAGVPRNGVT